MWLVVCSCYPTIFHSLRDHHFSTIRGCVFGVGGNRDTKKKHQVITKDRFVKQKARTNTSSKQEKERNKKRRREQRERTERESESCRTFQRSRNSTWNSSDSRWNSSAAGKLQRLNNFTIFFLAHLFHSFFFLFSLPFEFAVPLLFKRNNAFNFIILPNIPIFSSTQFSLVLAPSLFQS